MKKVLLVAIKMGRIPKVQKQKALDDEKAVHGNTIDFSNPADRDMYRNSNQQASPPAEELIEPPIRKQMKTSEPRSNGTTAHSAMPYQGAIYSNGIVLDLVYLLITPWCLSRDLQLRVKLMNFSGNATRILPERVGNVCAVYCAEW